MKPVHIFMAIAVAVIWGMGFIIAKAAMSHFSPILLMALRFTLTALCLGIFFPPPRRLFKSLFWVALVSAAIQYSLTFNGLRGIDASTAALLVQLEVPFGLLIAPGWYWGIRYRCASLSASQFRFVVQSLFSGSPDSMETWCLP